MENVPSQWSFPFWRPKLLLLLVAGYIIGLTFPSPASLLPRLSTSPHLDTATMSVTHLVLVKFPAATTAEQIKSISDEFFALKESCQTAEGKPYIISIRGGKNHSPEGFSAGLSHGYHVEFASKEDRDYYVFKDPAHLAFGKKLGGLVMGGDGGDAKVFDFTPGEF